MTQTDTSAVGGADFYDDEEVFHNYQRRRARPANPNDTLEKPVVWELLQELTLTGANILDLACGDGAFGRELLLAGCQSYIGIEASRRMVALAKETLGGTSSRVELATMENWQYPSAHFDIVLSRLALHYVDDLALLCRRVYQTLRVGGSFIFSVEHPVMTCCNRSRGEDGEGARQDWIVDDYFLSGRRDYIWMGKRVVKYHRTVEEYFTTLQESGFEVTRLRESRPQRHLFSDAALFQRRSRIPLFLFLAARRGE